MIHFLGLKLSQLKTAGDLEYNTADVTAGQVISDITKLVFKPAENANGNSYATFTFQVSDGFLYSPTYTMTINVTAVNDNPTLTDITSPAAILEGAGQQTVNLSGIGTGAANETQTLVVTATSSNTGLIPNPSVTYTSANATGSLSYTPVAKMFGSATITVTVNDGSGANNLTTKTFTVNVTNINDEPSFTKGSNQTVAEDAGAQSVSNWATSISKGVNESAQTLSFILTNDNK